MNEQSGAPGAGELEKIHRYTRGAVDGKDLYTFSVVLCDNDVDRDGERFSTAALHELAALFLGKTGISDHSMRSADQMARIFDTEVEAVPGRVNCEGEPYARLRARAYLPRIAKNEPLIAEIEAGIKKEVSVGCAVARSVCSVCGKPQGECTHRKGQRYNGKLCHVVLDGPEDAYEWSFVAVPAQREAGVVKAWDAEELKKRLQTPGGAAFSAGEAEGLRQTLERLERDAGYGREYRARLKGEVVRLALLAQPELPRAALERVAAAAALEDLLELEKAFRKAAGRAFPVRPQLAPEEKTERPDRDYLI